MVYIVIGFILGWLCHAFLSFKKYGKRLNEAEKRVWKLTPREERIKIRKEKLKVIMPSMEDDYIEEFAITHDMEEFPNK